MLNKIEKNSSNIDLVVETKVKKKFNKRQRLNRKRKLCKKNKSKDKLEVTAKKTSNIENLEKDDSISGNSIKKGKLKESKENNLTGDPPTKKRKRKETLQTKEDEVKKFKPIYVIKKPEEYSANWKKLKDVIGTGDKKNDRKEPSKGNKRKNNSELVSEDSTKNPVEESKKEEIWFDDVDPILLEDSQSIAKIVTHEPNINVVNDISSKENSKNVSPIELVTNKSFTGLTKTLALDCEMVGGGPDGEEDLLARVSIVNQFGNCLYDKHVKPREEVVDYRTHVSGIRPSDLVNGESYETVQKEVDALLRGRILVGHALSNDFNCLLLSHPRHMIRDTSRYKPFVQLFGGRTPSLKNLSEKVLGVKIQSGEHDSIQDSQAAMRLYTLNRSAWEKRANKKRIVQERRDKKRIADEEKEKLITPE